MKKKLLFLMLCLMSISVYAQNVKNDGKPYAYYCQIVGWQNLGGQLRIKMLWDNQKEENNLRDENGKKDRVLDNGRCYEFYVKTRLGLRRMRYLC